MIKTSKHHIQETNQQKLQLLNGLFDAYLSDITSYISYIVDGVLPLKQHLSSKLIPTESLVQAKLKRIAYAEASSIIRSQTKKATERRFKRYKRVYSYFRESGRQMEFVNKKFSELTLKPIYRSRYFTLPNVSNSQLVLTTELYNTLSGNHFDEFFLLPTNELNEKRTRGIKVHVPFKHHRHSLGLKIKGFKQLNSIGLERRNGKLFINLFWEKITPERTSGSSKGFDIGYKKLLACSDGKTYDGKMQSIYQKLSRQKQGSNNFKKTLTYRDNELNRIINSIDLSETKHVIIEDLKLVKFKSSLSREMNRQLSRWVYPRVIEKIQSLSEECGIKLEKVSPAYTSQTCSSCGCVDKSSRSGELFKCTSCGYEMDADINASINIHNRGTYSSSDKETE